jgi:hypothetical protein
MRRFILTSPLIHGSIDIIYGDSGLVQKVDFTDTTAAMGIRRTLLNRIAKFPLIDDAQQIIEGSQSTLVEAGFEVTFEMFWSKYNKKINRKRCEDLWKKMSKTKQVKAYYGIAAYDKYLSKEEWRSKADPENYLRKEMFDNEWK